MVEKTQFFLNTLYVQAHDNLDTSYLMAGQRRVVLAQKLFFYSKQLFFDDRHPSPPPLLFSTLAPLVFSALPWLEHLPPHCSLHGPGQNVRASTL